MDASKTEACSVGSRGKRNVFGEVVKQTTLRTRSMSAAAPRCCVNNCNDSEVFRCAQKERRVTEKWEKFPEIGGCSANWGNLGFLELTKRNANNRKA